MRKEQNQKSASTDSDERKSDRKRYQKPTITQFGSITDLTLAGGASVGDGGRERQS